MMSAAAAVLGIEDLVRLIARRVRNERDHPMPSTCEKVIGENYETSGQITRPTNHIRYWTTRFGHARVRTTRVTSCPR